MEPQDQDSGTSRVCRKTLQSKLARAQKEHKILEKKTEEVVRQLEQIEERKVDQEIDAQIFQEPANTERAKMEAELLKFHHENIFYLRALNETLVEEVIGGQAALEALEEFLIKRELKTGSGNEDTVTEDDPISTERVKCNDTESEPAKKKKKKRNKNKKKQKKTQVINEEVAKQRDIAKTAKDLVDKVISESLEELESEGQSKIITSSPENHQLHSLQETVKNKEETQKDLEENMAEQDCERSNAPQHTQHQNVKLSEQINILQEQLQELESEKLSKILPSSPDYENHQLHSLQGTVENKEKTVQDLEEKMTEQDCEQRNAPQDTQHQNVELSQQIKMLQEQLQERDVTIKRQQSELDKASKALSDAGSLISDLENRVSEKDNTIIELYSLREKDQEVKEVFNENITSLNQELQERDGKLDHLTEQLDGLKVELEKYKISAEEMEKYLEQVQRKNANEVERIHKEHQQELETLRSKHVSELEELKLLTDKQLEETGEEVEKLKQEFDRKVHELKESLGKQTTVNKNLHQQLETLQEHYDDVVACTRENDAFLEKLQFGWQKQVALRVTEISLLENDLRKMSAEIDELEDKMVREKESNVTMTKKLISLGEEMEQKNKELEESCEEMEKLKQVYDSEVYELKESLGKQTTVNKDLEQDNKMLEQTCEQMKKLKQVYDSEVHELKESLGKQTTANKMLEEHNKMVEQGISLLEKSICPVSNQAVGDSSLVKDSVERLEGAPDQAKLTSRINKLLELVQQKNKLDVKLRKELEETKDELEKEKDNFTKELNERETKERSLMDMKQKLERQLTEMEKECYDLLQELSLLQRKKKMNMFRHCFKCLRPS